MPNLCLPSLRLTVSTSEASVSSVSGESCCLKLAKSLPSESTWLGLGLGLGLRPGAQRAGAVEGGWGDAEGGARVICAWWAGGGGGGGGSGGGSGGGGSGGGGEGGGGGGGGVEGRG